MAGETDGNDDILEFGDADGGGRPRHRRAKLTVASVVVAGAAIAGTAVAVNAATHGTASVRTPRPAAKPPAAAQYHGAGSGPAQDAASTRQAITVDPAAGRVSCHHSR